MQGDEDGLRIVTDCQELLGEVRTIHIAARLIETIATSLDGVQVGFHL